MRPANEITNKEDGSQGRNRSRNTVIMGRWLATSLITFTYEHSGRFVRKNINALYVQTFDNKRVEQPDTVTACYCNVVAGTARQLLQRLIETWIGERIPE